MTEHQLPTHLTAKICDQVGTEMTYTYPCDIRVANPKPYDELILDQLGDSAIELLAKEVCRRRAAEIKDLTERLDKERRSSQYDRDAMNKMREVKDAHRTERDALQERCNKAEQDADRLRKALNDSVEIIKRLKRGRAQKAA